MGIEYKIKFAVPINYDSASLLRKLPSPIDRHSRIEIYNYAIEADGFYFVDNLGDRNVAAVALRSLLDEALRFSHTVELTEL